MTNSSTTLTLVMLPKPTCSPLIGWIFPLLVWLSLEWKKLPSHLKMYFPLLKPKKDSFVCRCPMWTRNQAIVEFQPVKPVRLGLMSSRRTMPRKSKMLSTILAPLLQTVLSIVINMISSPTFLSSKLNFAISTSILSRLRGRPSSSLTANHVTFGTSLGCFGVKWIIIFPGTGNRQPFIVCREQLLWQQQQWQNGLGWSAARCPPWENYRSPYVAQLGGTTLRRQGVCLATNRMWIWRKGSSSRLRYGLWFPVVMILICL